MAFMDIEVPLLGNDAEEAVRKGHSMLQPRVEARILQDLQIKPTDRVLEIGAGSGYMAALLAARAERVVSSKSTPSWPKWPVRTCAMPVCKTPTCARAAVPATPSRTAPLT